jgi:hypothetical protein
MRIVRDTGKPIAQVGRDPGINAGTLVIGLLGSRRTRRHTRFRPADLSELKRLRAEVADVPHSVRPEERQTTVANYDPDRMRLQIRTPGDLETLELVACDRLPL